MKKTMYEAPQATVLHIQTETLIAQTTVNAINNNVNLKFGGGTPQDVSDPNARVKEQSNYNVWDDDWSAE